MMGDLMAVKAMPVALASIARIANKIIVICVEIFWKACAVCFIRMRHFRQIATDWKVLNETVTGSRGGAFRVQLAGHPEQQQQKQHRVDRMNQDVDQMMRPGI